MKGAKKYEDYWRGVISEEIGEIHLPHTQRRDILLGYAMALSDAANVARKWKHLNHVEPLGDDLPEFPRWPKVEEA